MLVHRGRDQVLVARTFAGVGSRARAISTRPDDRYIVEMESEFLNWLQSRLPPHPDLPLGFGDDAAVVRIGGNGNCVVTCDTLTDGVDFDLRHVDPAAAGRKALAANLSDLAAMAAHPVAAFVALVVPRAGGLQLAQRMFAGLLPLAEEFQVAIAGGDTNAWDGPLVIGITLLGREHRLGSVTRGGAQPGDVLLVTGQFGGSILGRQFDFPPRVREAIWLRDHLHSDWHAATDVSDGLSLDLWHIAQASGCGAVIEAEQVPVADAARRLAAESGKGLSPLDHALSDGEDFELILAVSPAAAEQLIADSQRHAFPELSVPVTRIGSFVAARGLWLQQADGSRIPWTPRGYQH
jgi:thiamine-monophosphate kinase